jgi:aryl-alcohol dehydrogenase-like predicted oxidoreductase
LLAADPAIAEVATKHRVSPSQVALAWQLHHSGQILLIPGTRSVERLEENIAASDIELDEQDMRRLDVATELANRAAPAEHSTEPESREHGAGQGGAITIIRR